jgi:hypothetical protein
VAETIVLPTIEKARGMGKTELIKLLHHAGLKKFDRRYSHATLVRAMVDYDLIAQDEEEDEYERMKYMVRYVGANRNNVFHGENSTPSGNKYSFTREAWVSLTERDYREKYEKAVIRSIELNEIPVWDVQEISTFRGVINKFAEKIKSIAGSKYPKEIFQLKQMNSSRLKILHEHNIFTLAQLLKFPSEWISAQLNISHVETIDMLEDAKEGLRRLGNE